MEWLVPVLTSVLTAAFVGAVSAAYVRILRVRHEVNREYKADQASVLLTAIDDLKLEREEIKKERDGFKDVLSDLRSEHTACLLEQERLRASNKSLRIELGHMEARLSSVEQQLVDKGHA